MKTLIHEHKNYLSEIVSTHAADLKKIGIRLCLSANEIFELSHSNTPYKNRFPKDQIHNLQRPAGHKHKVSLSLFFRV